MVLELVFWVDVFAVVFIGNSSSIGSLGVHPISVIFSKHSLFTGFSSIELYCKDAIYFVLPFCQHVSVPFIEIKTS
jgi:hypothetical protein